MRHALHSEPPLNRIRMNQKTGYAVGSYVSIQVHTVAVRTYGLLSIIATALFRMYVDLDHTDPRIADSNPARGINLGYVRVFTVLGFPEVLSITRCLLCPRGPTKLYESFITSESLPGEGKLLERGQGLEERE
jgi:hypothetical protein